MYVYVYILNIHIFILYLNMWRDSLSNSELEFMAESTEIQITPKFRKEQITLLSGTFGPFKPNKQISVPLWFAIQLYKSKQCKITIPSFLENGYLRTKIDEEKELKGSLVYLPNYFFEIAQILLNQASSEFENVKITRELVEDLSAMRMEKINEMLETITEDDLHYKLEAINDKEIEQIRPLLNIIFPMRLDLYVPTHRNPTENMLFVKPTTSNNGLGVTQSQEQSQSQISFSSGFV